MGIGAAIGLSVASGVISGVAAEKAGKAQQKQLKKQAEVVRAEAKRDAGRLRIRHKQATARKKLQFFKQGVAIPGSPANILASDINLQDEEARAIIARGDALSNLLITQGQNARNAGRAALIGGIVSGISSGVMIGALSKGLQTENLDTLGTSTKSTLPSTNLSLPRISEAGVKNVTPGRFGLNFNRAIATP